jgi:hypothetical protein
MARPRKGRTYGHERRIDRDQYRVSPILRYLTNLKIPTQVIWRAKLRVISPLSTQDLDQRPYLVETDQGQRRLCEKVYERS